MKKQCRTYSMVFFLSIFGILAFPVFMWGFVNDDFIFLHYCIKTPWANILSFFYHGSPSNNGVYANAPMPKISFLVALYRPLLSLIIKVQTTFFGLNSYAYKLAILVLHTCMSTVIFNVLLSFFSVSIALVSALFFAFHPSLFDWLGVLACQTYAFDLLFLLLIIWMLKKFFITNKFNFYLTACCLAFFSMLARETLLFLPAWIIMFTLFMCNKQQGFIFLSTRPFATRFGYAIKITSGFVISHAVYVALKLYLFPFNKLDSGTGFALTPSSFFARQLDRFYDIVTYLCDFFGISLIPGNHQLLKGCLLMAGITLLTIPFFILRQKILFLFLFFSLAIFNWTSLLITHHPRYIYIGLPFFIFMFAYALTFYITQFKLCKKPILFSIYALSLLLIAANINNQYITARSLHIFSSAIERLANDTTLDQRTLYLVGLPMPWSGIGIEEGLLLYNPEFSNKVVSLRETYKESIRFLTETHHKNAVASQEQLQKIVPSYKQALFISWDFQKHCFYHINPS